MTARFSWRALATDRRGNVLMIMAFALIPLSAATGMAIDYSRAARLQTKMNAAADAGALSGVTTPMMSTSMEDSAKLAAKMFLAQVDALNGMTWKKTLKATPTVTQTATKYTLDYGGFTVTVTDTNNAGLNRVVTVTYDAYSDNAFKGVLKMDKAGIGGSSTASAKIAPNIDFYMMLDVSSSMALPTTSAGINFLKSKTKRSKPNDPNGCAFACHETHPDNPNITDKSGKIIDYYTYAHLNGIELRIDAGKRAIADTMTKAEKQAETSNATYRFGVSTFSRAVNFKEVAPMTDDYAEARAQTKLAETIPVTMSEVNYDRQTEHADSLIRQQAIMPVKPGQGTNRPGDSAQAILFLITDGMRDEERNGRQMGAMPTDQCTAIKARGIRIAVLYTTYQPESVNYDNWSRSNVVPKIPSVSPALQRCATAGLFFQVSTDQDISTALQSLFEAAVATARITN